MTLIGYVLVSLICYVDENDNRRCYKEVDSTLEYPLTKGECELVRDRSSTNTWCQAVYKREEE